MAATTSLAFLGDVGGPELLLVLFIVLLLFGGEKLPQLARGLGKSMREFKKAASTVEGEIKRAIDEAPDKTTPPPPATKPDEPTEPLPYDELSKP